MKELCSRRENTATRLEQLRQRLGTSTDLAARKACAYATGSFGRCEAGRFSDLDLFIVGKNNGIKGADGREGSLLKELDAVCIKADLIGATRALGIPEFSGDGRYLVHYSVDDFTKRSDSLRTTSKTHSQHAFFCCLRVALFWEKRCTSK